MDEPSPVLTVHHPMPLMPKTIPMRIAASGIALMLLASLGAGLWLVLPRWCPELVIRFSPWVEPVLRAHGFRDQNGLAGMYFAFRFMDWGRPVQSYLHRTLFTHPDEAMCRAAFSALDDMDRHGDDTKVVEATFVALAYTTGGTGLLSDWERSDDGVTALLAAYRSLDPEHQAELVRRLHGPELEDSYMRSPALVHCYLEFLDSPHPAVRAAALGNLSETSMESAFPDLFYVVRILHPESPGTVASAYADLLRVLDEPSDVSGIISWLGKSSGQPDALMHLAYACALLCNPVTVPALATCLTSTDVSVRIHVLQALRNIGDARALDAVIPLLADLDESVRCMAVWTIGRLRDQRVPELLKKMLDDPDPLVVSAAEHSLAEFIPPGIDIPPRKIPIP